MSSEDDREGSPSAKRKKFLVERPKEEINEEKLGEEDVFGPCLPPHLLERKHMECSSQQKIYGPVLPDTLRTRDEDEKKDCPSTSEPGKGAMIGPEIPEYLKARLQAQEDKDEEEKEGSEQECERHDEGDEDDEKEEFFGPSPSLMTTETASSSFGHYRAAFERKRVVGTSEESKEEKKRESWMLELPEKKTGIFDLGPRKFKTNFASEKESDRSVWTETPQDKLKKKSHKKEKDYNELLKAKMLDERNKEMEELAKSSSKSKHREKKSLMEMHTKKMKKKKKKEAEKNKDKKPERRPFDRNVDLQIRRIDENQRKSILNKAMYLNSRFAAGESKFL